MAFILLNTTAPAPTGYSRVEGVYRSQRAALRSLRLAGYDFDDQDREIWKTIDSPAVGSYHCTNGDEQISPSVL